MVYQFVRSFSQFVGLDTKDQLTILINVTDYKGPDGAAVNVPQTPGYCAGVISGLDPGTGAATTNFYTTYCANKPSKACMVRCIQFRKVKHTN
jgi:hypothetical protein